MSSGFEHFSLATHNGCITIQSPTGGHRTFRIRTQDKDATFKPGERIVALLTGSDNTSSYTQLGTIAEGGVVRLWRKQDTQHNRHLMHMLENPAKYTALGCSYIYEGRCRVCNRLLTTPESCRSGIGPVCEGRG